MRLFLKGAQRAQVGNVFGQARNMIVSETQGVLDLLPRWKGKEE
jgi:hypothetical protein